MKLLAHRIQLIGSHTAWWPNPYSQPSLLALLIRIIFSPLLPISSAPQQNVQNLTKLPTNTDNATVTTNLLLLPLLLQDVRLDTHLQWTGKIARMPTSVTTLLALMVAFVKIWTEERDSIAFVLMDIRVTCAMLWNKRKSWDFLPQRLLPYLFVSLTFSVSLLGLTIFPLFVHYSLFQTYSSSSSHCTFCIRISFHYYLQTDTHKLTGKG